MAEESTRVLVVDDERFFREAICDALRDASIDCITAEREEDAFELARRSEVGVVILDIGTPGGRLTTTSSGRWRSSSAT